MSAEWSRPPAEAVDPLILAIDVGTSSARALVYDGHAHAVEGWEVHRPYAVETTADGGVVTDADLLLRLVGECIDGVLSAADKSSRRIASVACSTFWHSLLGVDADAQVVTPLFTWADTRSREAARDLQGRLDTRAVHARTGCVLHSSYLPAKLLWLSRESPGAMDRSAYWMSFGEFLYLRVFGTRRISVSMASGTGLFDQNRCDWDPEVLSALPIRREQLSPLAEFSDAMEGLQPAFANRWPGLRDVPWNLAVGDGACNNVGSGGFCAEWPVAMIGTSGALRVVYETQHVTIPWGLWTYRVDHRRIVQGGALSAGGNVFAWLQHTLRMDLEPQLEAELLAMEPDAHGLTVLPFLAGERSPDWNVDAQAAIVGMTLDTSPLDIARACLEAVIYRFGVIHDILKQVIPTRRGIIGSGAGLIRSPAWMQIMTDVLGEPMVTSRVPEASSRGAALLVLEAMGTIKDLRQLPAPLGAHHAPDPAHAKIYQAAMTRQRHLYDLLIRPPDAQPVH